MLWSIDEQEHTLTARRHPSELTTFCNRRRYEEVSATGSTKSDGLRKYIPSFISLRGFNTTGVCQLRLLGSNGKYILRFMTKTRGHDKPGVITTSLFDSSIDNREITISLKETKNWRGNFQFRRKRSGPLLRESPESRCFLSAGSFSGPKRSLSS